MSEIFRWQSSYSVQVDVLDAQHRHLIALLNDLREAVDSGQGASAADQIFKQLVAYTKYHFGEEERLMAKHDFPGLAAHKLEHDLLTRRVLLFKKSYDEGNTSLIPMSLLIFLQDWLKGHILGTDKQYSEFLNRQGVR